MLLIGDYFYYSFFGAHYNLLIFGIVDDDTQAVLKSMWTDFPVIRIVLFIILLSVLFCFVVKKIYHSKRIPLIAQTKWGRYSFIVVILLTAFFLRGRLGMFPLRKEDAFFSKNQFVNVLTSNGIFTFKDAYGNYSRNKLDISIDKILEDSQFLSDKELVSKYLNLPLDSIVNDPLSYLKVQTKTDSLLQYNPPHVIVLQMEGMGLNILDLHTDDFQIMGKLADELPYCITYKKFLPFYENTIFSLEGLLTSSVITPVSLTQYLNKLNLASATIPFHEAGYTTTFVTGAKKAWRNLEVYLPAQGFDNYESKENIEADIPDAIVAEWGIYDRYMFQQIWNRLDGAEKPQFIYGMSITNHTPYAIPPGYSVSNLNMSDSLKKRLLTSESGSYDCFSTYRYACDCLGDFIRKIRESPMSENVIIAVTGDHSIKGILQVSDNDILTKHGVPLILYVPERYLNDKVINTNYWGSHKDIFPTLFNLALSNSSYYGLGNDLLSAQADNNFAVNMSVAVMDSVGAIFLETKQWYRWPEGEGTVLVPIDNDDSLNDLEYKFKLWSTISKYITLRSIEK